MIVTAYNPDTSALEKTYISSYQAKGVTTLPVKNNDRFIAGRRALIGRMGSERSELVTLGTISTDKLSVTVSATQFEHNADDPIFLLDWDQIRFYRRTSAGGSSILLQTYDIDVDNYEQVTRWDDTAALASYYYQTSFYNSITLAESDLSDVVQATGYDINSAGNIVDQVVRRVRDTSFNVLTMEEYLDVMNEVGSDLITQAQKPYVFLKKTVTLNTVADQNYIDIKGLVPDFWKYDYVEIGINTGGANTRFQEVSPISFEQWNNRYKYTPSLAQDNIRDVAFDDETKRLYLFPTPKTAVTGSVILHYYKKFTAITKAGDIVETPNNLLYRYKLMAEYYSAKSEVDNQWAMLAKKYEDKYGNEIVKMQRVNRLDVGTPRSMRPARLYRPRRYHL